MTIEKIFPKLKRWFPEAKQYVWLIDSRDILMQKKTQQECFLWNCQNIKFIQSKVKFQRYR